MKLRELLGIKDMARPEEIYKAAMANYRKFCVDEVNCYNL